MHRLERDIQAIRAVGTLILGVGLIQLFLTGLLALFGLFSLVPSSSAPFLQTVLGILLSLVMASIMSSCGIQLQRLRHYSESGVQEVRLVWTALVIVMALGAIAGLWIEPPLTSLAVLTLIALFAIRPAIIRLSSN